MDWLIVGLGNPGSRYEGTRHNIGFAALSAIAQTWGLPKPKDRFKGRIAEGRVRLAPEAAQATHLPRVALLWPQTFMNDAGRSVGPARGALRLPLERVLVLHDEIDLRFGEVKARLGGGLAGHNGLKSVSRELGGPGFWRVRIGVGRPDSTDPEIVASYVLSRFQESEAEVSGLIDDARKAAEALVLSSSEQ